MMTMKPLALPASHRAGQLAACSGRRAKRCRHTRPATNGDRNGRHGTSEMGTVRPCQRLRTNRRAVVATPAPNLKTVPARFRGLYALDRQACAADYTYQQAFQNVTVKADSVNFFETGGPVTDVNVNGDSIAITLRETVGDNVATRAIYLALNPDGTVRYRAGKTAMVRKYVRCQG